MDVGREEKGRKDRASLGGAVWYGLGWAGDWMASCHGSIWFGVHCFGMFSTITRRVLPMYVNASSILGAGQSIVVEHEQLVASLERVVQNIICDARA